MRINHIDSIIKSWNQFSFVEPDPTDDLEDGGGGGGSDDDLGENGAKALRNEREQRKALEREMARLKQQLDAVKDLNPNTYKEAQEKASKLERELQEKDQLTAAERQRLEAKHQQAVQQAKSAAEQEKAKRVALEIKTAVRSFFAAAEGRDGADPNGLSFFDAYMDVHGRHHFRLDEATGKTFVVDNDGDRIKKEDGSDVNPIEWLNNQADNSLVIGTFFKPKGGVGSGGLVGARGVRAQQTLSAKDLEAITPGKLIDDHYASQ